MFSKDSVLKNGRMSSTMKREDAQKPQVFGFVSWKMAMFLERVTWGLGSEPPRDWLKSGR